MNGAISYSLFGYGKERQKNSFDFNSYLRGVMVNARINRLIYPDWEMVLNIDKETLNGEFNEIFVWLDEEGLIVLQEQESKLELCRAMLCRMNPIFAMKDDKVRWARVLCRDLDSVGTYREAQAVKQWVDECKTIHCITDSVSHTIPMLGGMIGIRSAFFKEGFNVTNLEDLLRQHPMSFERKGSDQTFLNRVVYPKFSISATEHFVKGMPWNLKEENGRHYSIPDIDLGINPDYKELNLVCGHIGSAGYYDAQMVQFLNEKDPYHYQYEEIESKFKNIFYWRS